MGIIRTAWRGALLAILGCIAGGIAAAEAAQSPASHVVTQATIDQWKKQYSNWGRWGAEDDKGTLNLITDAKRRQAAGLVRDGNAVSLERDIVAAPAGDGTPSRQGSRPQGGASPAEAEAGGGRRGGNPPVSVQQRMLSGPPARTTGSTDSLTIAAHGYDLTHFDAFGHHLMGGRMYNGYPAAEYLSMDRGLSRGSVISSRNGFFTRGVLVDIPRLKGVPYLEPGTPIYVEDIEAWEKKAHVRIGPGDAVFIRTGRWEREAAVGKWSVGQQAAGLDASVIPWLRQRDVALLGSESALSVVPFPKTTTIVDPDDYLPVHNFALVMLGMNLIDNCDLGPLAAAAAQRNRWEFLITVAPIRVTTATGVPINPIAVF